MRSKFIWAITFISFIFLSFVSSLFGKFPQVQSYHLFVDTRSFWGIPNFFDVMSNLVFLFVGLNGLRSIYRNSSRERELAWWWFFLGVTLVAPGSAFYHWSPNDFGLYWDRLPMSLAFMGLVVALLEQFFSKRFSSEYLHPFLFVGIASVTYWYWQDDLRPYLFIQILPLLMILTLVTLDAFKKKKNIRGKFFFYLAFVFYILAKFAETFDQQVFSLSQERLSGHTMKHLLAGLAVYQITLAFRLNSKPLNLE